MIAASTPRIEAPDPEGQHLHPVHAVNEERRRQPVKPIVEGKGQPEPHGEEQQHPHQALEADIGTDIAAQPVQRTTDAPIVVGQVAVGSESSWPSGLSSKKCSVFSFQCSAKRSPDTEN